MLSNEDEKEKPTHFGTKYTMSLLLQVEEEALTMLFATYSSSSAANSALAPRL